MSPITQQTVPQEIGEWRTGRFDLLTAEQEDVESVAPSLTDWIATATERLGYDPTTDEAFVFPAPGSRAFWLQYLEDLDQASKLVRALSQSDRGEVRDWREFKAELASEEQDYDQ